MKLRHKGNGQPNVGVIYAHVKDRQQRGLDYYQILWDIPQWSESLWRERELEVISEGG
ncbi:MAG: hypothetical protein QF416_11550 [Candidatus Marinimicrobia bacterium]|nr:hypothetical protein [Candidatus Neomarinimicrobiota bacterium]